MRRSGFILAILVIAYACGWAAGPAGAVPAARPGATAWTVEPIVQRAAHKEKSWRWDGGGWWRRGPWADHRISGIVFTRAFPAGVFLAWGPNRLHYCAARYRSFDPVTGTYLTYRGERRICH